ncbi:MAG: hypothetical protein HZA61_00725 [Candidatus Eisenbacteria bacterium]|uniref:YbjN domain-containing protein n=1 Tax=Eiseniibacteriota bacterium TaxID=2212470 RepID=A0A933S8P3_UNCEI|nr:hypothetical protein [Candidatus Eisenbacteria bacterium]
MTTQAMGKLLESYLQDFEGQPGFWRGTRHDVPVFVFSDDEHDRMRLMSPIGIIEELDTDLLHALLMANYDRALDARYAMRGQELWSVVVHPLATLATDDLPSLFDQVVTLAKNTGTSFASTELVFQAMPDELVLEPAEDDADGEDDEEDGDEGERHGTRPSLDDDDEEDDEDDEEEDGPRR